MAKHFDLKKQLKLHDKTLLRRLFADEHAVLTEVPWDTLRPHEVDPIVEGWNAIPDETRRQLEVILQDVNELADERSQKVLVEDIDWRCPEKRDAFAAWRSLQDKALWAYLDARDTFDEAAIFARAEALRGGQFSNRWNSLPKKKLIVTDALKSALEVVVRDYYREKELRGDQCRVHHYARANGADYFYAYLPEWADKRLGFDPNGNLTSRELNYAFHNVFIFEPDDGALEIIAKGGRQVQLPLRRAFCDAVLGVAVEDTDPIKRCYQLDHLLDPAFAFNTEAEDRIASVRLRRVRLLPNVTLPALEGAELKLRENASVQEVRTAVAQFLKAYNLSQSQLAVVQAGIQIEFQSDGKRRARTMTFNVGIPNSCDLKSKPDDVRAVGERCIRRWGILRA
ncbi:hypothetical protein BH11PLA2_BH11PLA2_37040 [soil metagenome]